MNMEEIPRSHTEDNAEGLNTETKMDSSYRRLRQAVDYLQENTIKLVGLEREKVAQSRRPWLVYDTPLEFAAGEPLADSGYDYNRYFSSVLEGQKIEDYLASIFGRRSVNIAEFGGPFRAASADIAKKVNVNASLGLTLVDHRSEDQKWEDAENSHSVVEGDIFLSDFKQAEDGEKKPGLGEVDKWIRKNGKIDFLLVRLAGPYLSFLNNDKGEYPKNILRVQPEFKNKIPDIGAMQYIFVRNFTKWYETLAEGGVILADIPGDFKKEIETLADRFVDNNGNKLFDIKAEVSMEKDITTEDVQRLKKLGEEERKRGLEEIPGIYTTAIKLRRLPGSPDKLSVDDLIDSW